MSEKNVKSGSRGKAMIGLRGAGLIALAPLQFWIGNGLLSAHPLQRAVTVVGIVGAVLVFASTLVLTAGLGETGNWLVQAMSRD